MRIGPDAHHVAGTGRPPVRSIVRRRPRPGDDGRFVVARSKASGAQGPVLQRCAPRRPHGSGLSDHAEPPTPSRRRRGDIGMLLAASMLSAVLASGATAALGLRPATTATTDRLVTALLEMNDSSCCDDSARVALDALGALGNDAVVRPVEWPISIIQEKMP